MSVLAVDLSDLHAYAALVRRAADDCTAVGAASGREIPDGDFGRILELMSGDYEVLLPQVQAVMAEDGRRLGRTAEALSAIAGDLAETDHQVARAFGLGLRLTGDRRAPAFGGGGAMSVPCLVGSTVALPQVHLGFPYDQVCDLVVRIGLSDPREHVTRFIAGDVGKALTQAAYWEAFAGDLGLVGADLARGGHRIRDSWEGRAADRADATMQRWLAALADQGCAMSSLGGHLRDLVAEAVDMAQLVVDLLRFFLSTVSAGWSYAYLPIYGEIELIRKIREAWHLVMDARKVLAVFWGFVRVIAGAIGELVELLSTSALPAAPGLPLGR